MRGKVQYQFIWKEDWIPVAGASICTIAIVVILAARVFWGFTRLEFLYAPFMIGLVFGVSIWSVSRVPRCPRCSEFMRRMPSTPTQNRVPLRCEHCGYEKWGTTLPRGLLTPRPVHGGYLGNELLNQVEQRKKSK